MSQTPDPKYSWVFQRLTENDQGTILKVLLPIQFIKA